MMLEGCDKKIRQMNCVCVLFTKIELPILGSQAGIVPRVALNLLRAFAEWKQGAKRLQ